MESTATTNYVSIRPNCISLYSLPDNRKERSEAQKNNEKNLIENLNKGVISLKANKRVKDAINWLVYLSDIKSYWNKKQKKQIKFRLSFTTLTLSASQNLTDNEIKSKFLNQILVVLRNDYNVKHYVWRAEAQVNGNIHFHIVCDKFVPWHKLRNQWNNIQNKVGYIDTFHAKHKHKKPNSVDVHEVVGIKNLASYLAEYCTKQTKGFLYTPIQWVNGKAEICTNPKDMLMQNTPMRVKGKKGNWSTLNSVRVIFGKQWGLSTSLSQIKSAKHVRDSTMESELHTIRSAFAGKVFEHDYVTCIYVSVKEWKAVVNGYLFKLFKMYLQAHKHRIDGGANAFFDIVTKRKVPPKPIELTPLKIAWSNNFTQQSLEFSGGF